MSDSTAPSNSHPVTSNEHFQALLSEDLERISLINFWASWAAPCVQMNEVVLELAKKYPKVLVLQVEAESLPDIAESFNVEAVPSFVVLKGHTLLERISGADAPALTKALVKYASTPIAIVALSQTTQSPAAPSGEKEEKKEETQEELNERLRGLMNQDKVVLFMKGSPDQPRCGFSKRLVALLKEQGTEFRYFDIFTDESVRSGLKVLNNWPTFPQLVVKGEFVGGLDIVQEMVDNGEYAEIMTN